ncbi:SGNH/GDSL hydrolase family protein [Nostoc sp. 'Peltigera membranacea cyanobiont' 232]|uniref:SGNH/GDSL hydrolase family protein n=1 Tax=Nostoc sp. 'Peltigera membranacea cyanobiont' 232 TaxID=2014531 RepID=UPI000B9571D1|nr:SGNH/GDSL hydrolase family protein [Nostoc sp. 'Peltigera membranacea cyanobiont' 232]OYE04792.1 GDSL family lipase [Nostoc sp. 'Peltigera membranacea cyanobiont' 232]
MKKQAIAAGFVLLSFMLPLKASAASFSKFYVFGDSLSDTGNVFAATGGLVAPTTAIPQDPPYFQGRFSNQQVWVDYLGDQLGLTPSPYITLNPAIPNQGINFAVGGASSGQGNAVVPNAPLPGVLEQVGLLTQPILQANQKLDPNALYAVWGGANDYVFGQATNTTQTVQNLSDAVGLLASSGAKNILVFNLPDLGKIPLALATGQSNNLTALTNEHNKELAEELDKFSNNPDLNLISVDVSSLFNQIQVNPGEFGFQNATNPCVVGNFQTIISVCSQPNDYLFYDSVHPTTNAHKLIADAALAAIEAKSVPEPAINLGILALGAFGAVGVLKRQQKRSLLVSAGRVVDAQLSHTTVEN